MRLFVVAIGILLAPGVFSAQAPGKFPPDSLINVQVFPRTTPVMEVVGAMRNMSGALGVRCQFCHVGEEGMPLARFDFAKDEKRPKLVARHMMRMVQEINRRLDTIPGREANGVRHLSPRRLKAAAPLDTGRRCSDVGGGRLRGPRLSGVA